MLVATAVAALGFVAVAAGTRRYGLRLGGTIVLGVLAVYTLKNFSTLPIFLVSTTIAYLTLAYTKRKTLIYGRDEFVVAILSGSLAPAMVYLTTLYLPGSVQMEIYRSVFIGSLLSGAAAFNLHQMRPDYRWKDVVGAAGIYVSLLLLGAVLVGPSTRFLADYTPLVLFANTSDIAVLRGAVVEGFVDSEFVGRPFTIGVFAGMLGLSELVRQRFGIRIGTIALGLVAIYTVSTWRLLALYLVVFVIVFAAITAVHRTVVLYGRALLSTAGALGVVVAVPLVIALDISAGLSALFAAVLASLMAYYVHHTSPPERYQQAALIVAVFVPVLLVVRTLVAPGPEGLPQTVGVREVGLGVVVTAAAIAVAERHRIKQPSDDAVRVASMFGTEEN